MRRYLLPVVAGVAAAANTTSLSDVCTAANVRAALPANGTLLGINLIPSSVTATVSNTSSSTGGMMKRQSMGGSSTGTSYTYCAVNVTYERPGKTSVQVQYAFPEPSSFKNRYYVAGGGGFSLSSSATGGLEYGASGGATSAGYDAFDNAYDDEVLYANGSINWDATYMFSYQALGEMTSIAKPLTQGFYGLSSDTKIYTYFEGCSDGGREGMSQVQRYGDMYDGAITGAPAFRFAQQQVHHVFSSAVEQTLDYYPKPCALDKIVNATIKACDPLDGRTDGVVSRTDLCQLNFNLSSIIGESYYCAAETSTSLGFGFSKRAAGSETSYAPAQNGTVTADDIRVAQTIYNGLHNSKGERAYLSWQIAAQLSDASTEWSNSTQSWGLDIPSTGGEYVTKFVELLNLTNLANLDNVTYDTLVEWMEIGMVRYYDSLQTTFPDLTLFQSSGGKLLHYHGESDPSIPTGSSVHYWQAVCKVMYGDKTSQQECREKFEDWVRTWPLALTPSNNHVRVSFADNHYSTNSTSSQAQRTAAPTRSSLVRTLRTT